MKKVSFLALVLCSCASNPQTPEKAVSTTVSMDTAPLQKANEDFFAYVKEYLEPKDPRVDALINPVVSVIPYQDGFAVQVRRNENDFRLSFYRGASSKPERELDLSEAIGKNITQVKISPDGKILAYSITSGGNEKLITKILRIGAKGFEKIFETPTADRRFNFLFSPDSRILTYVQEVPASDSDRLTFGTFAVNLTTAKDVQAVVAGHGTYQELVFIEKPQIVLALSASSSASALTVKAKKFEQLMDPSVKWTTIADESQEVRGVESDGNHAFFLIKKSDGSTAIDEKAIDGQLTMKAEPLFSSRELSFMTIHGSRTGMYVIARRDYKQVVLFKKRGMQAFANLAEFTPGETVSSLVASSISDQTFLRTASFQHDGVFKRIDPRTQKIESWAENLQTQSVATIELERLIFEAKSQNGTSVPYVVVRKKGSQPNATTKALVLSYGSYGMPTAINYVPAYDAWFNDNGIRVYCLVRGGGDKGVAWRQAGQGPRKINAAYDSIACAEDVVERGLANGKRLGFYSGSAGGLVIGGILHKRPKLFKAIIAGNAVLAITEHMQSKQGMSNVSEYGDPKVPSDAAALREMDASLAIEASQGYPSFLLHHGYNDARVPFRYSYEFYKKLNANPGQEEKVFLRTQFDGGHGLDSAKAQANAVQAEMVAYLRRTL
ncbi:MAG: prolyl oligopeptidase family serine peptidase [Pseudobdellovibrionaceae bacterium]|nr:prolyl oligopeptidase family serine peptidase [Pseudobdellovibrionaceae bacterium]